MVVLGGEAVSYERGTPVVPRFLINMSFSWYPLSREFGTNKTVTTRFGLWFETFPGTLSGFSGKVSFNVMPFSLEG